MIAASLAYISPSVAAAEVCDKERPDWDGVPVTIWEETIALGLSPGSLILLAITLLAIRFRNQWLGLLVMVGWTAFASVLTMADPTGVRDFARAEGCMGSPAVFIGLVAALCIGTIIYTAPLKSRPKA